jgi:hypothetical protein
VLPRSPACVWGGVLADLAGGLVGLGDEAGGGPALAAFGVDELADPVLAGGGGEELAVDGVVDVLRGGGRTFE